jgi:hypothetical protein
LPRRRTFSPLAAGHRPRRVRRTSSLVHVAKAAHTSSFSIPRSMYLLRDCAPKQATARRSLAAVSSKKWKKSRRVGGRFMPHSPIWSSGEMLVMA